LWEKIAWVRGWASPSLFTHAKGAQSVNHDRNTRVWRSNLFEGRVPVIFISMIRISFSRPICPPFLGYCIVFFGGTALQLLKVAFHVVWIV
jgi:hypothetical protein